MYFRHKWCYWCHNWNDVWRWDVWCETQEAHRWLTVWVCATQMQVASVRNWAGVREEALAGLHSFSKVSARGGVFALGAWCKVLSVSRWWDPCVCERDQNGLQTTSSSLSYNTPRPLQACRPPHVLLFFRIEKGNCPPKMVFCPLSLSWTHTNLSLQVQGIYRQLGLCRKFWFIAKTQSFSQRSLNLGRVGRSQMEPKWGRLLLVLLATPSCLLGLCCIDSLGHFLSCSPIQLVQSILALPDQNHILPMGQKICVGFHYGGLVFMSIQVVQ